MPFRDAQICCNGHVVSSSKKDIEKFCSQCGSATISECQNCNASIRGREYEPGVIAVYPYTVPAYCYNCGAPYPWTKAKFEAMKELIEFDSELSAEEKSYMSDNLEDLTVDTPKTKVVATKFNIFLRKVGSVTASAIRDILVDIASETAKKIIFGQ